MLIPPSPWVEVYNAVTGVTTYEGGYLTEHSSNGGSAGRVIHGHRALVKSKPSKTAMEFLNRVQEQPWKINCWILDILEALLEDNHEIGSFVSYVKKKFVIPEIPDEILDLPDSDPKKLAAKSEMIAALVKQRDLKNKQVHPLQAISLAREWRDKEAFWIPWFFDTRLRAYPLVPKLSPQGTDFQKALLLFADGAEVTAENRQQTYEVLLIAIATTYGNKVDKRSFAYRLNWSDRYIKKNLEKILSDPLSQESKDLWTKADEPFQHLALLKELKDVFFDQTTTTCRVPIGYDATCSGLQLLGSFVKDETTCTLVNVLPGAYGDRSAPRDAYGAVAMKAREILSDKARWSQIKGMEEIDHHQIPIDKIDRKVAKKVVMLIPYGGSYPTLKGHVDEATKTWNLDFKQVNWLTKVLIRSMDEAVPGFSALNVWFKQAAKAAMDQGLETITWRTSTGSVITQTYRDPLTKQIHTFLTNKAKVRTEERKSRRHETSVVEQKVYLDWEERVDHPSVAVGWGDVLKRKNETALAANWTHSQDAAVLQTAFSDFNMPFTTVHDCLYCPAPVIPDAVMAVRKAFVTVVTWSALEEFAVDNGLNIPLPVKGNADVKQALKSSYLFS
jgi:DNA-directed RNA polymerase